MNKKSNIIIELESRELSRALHKLTNVYNQAYTIILNEPNRRPTSSRPFSSITAFAEQIKKIEAPGVAKISSERRKARQFFERIEDNFFQLYSAFPQGITSQTIDFTTPPSSRSTSVKDIRVAVSTEQLQQPEQSQQPEQLHLPEQLHQPEQSQHSEQLQQGEQVEIEHEEHSEETPTEPNA